MVRDPKRFSEDRLPQLEQLLGELTNALNDQKGHLERHTAAMEKLAGALRQLDSTLKREVPLESHQSLLRLDELIRMFVEYEINPRYYQSLGTSTLKSLTDARHTELTTQKQNPKPKKKNP